MAQHSADRQNRVGIVVVVAVLLGAVAVFLGARGGDTTAEGTVCAAVPALKVTAAPELAQSVSAALRRLQDAAALGDSDPRCPAPTATAGDPASIADFLATAGAVKPDVWIPDSSMWTARLAVAGATMPAASPSISRSPLVLAVPTTGPAATALAASPGWSGVLPTAGAPTARLGLPAPKRLATTMSALVELRALAQSRPTGVADLSAVFRAAKLDVSGQSPQARFEAAAKDDLAVPATEQEVVAYNRNKPAAPMKAIYPADQSAMSLDYPFVVLTTDPARQARATKLLTALQDDTGRAALATAGFRDPAGASPASLAASPGIDAARPGAGAAPDPASVVAAVGSLDRITLGSQVLAVIDVSGSMASKVPGAGGATRLDLAVRAAVAGLAVYPDDTKAGLWAFSTQLTPTTDYQVLTPLGVLGKGDDGVTGRQRMGQGLAAVRVKPDGGTALYDTLLAAVREVRSHWDSARVNSVIIITDGANEDDMGIDLATLLGTLKAENDPAKPVWVFPVAYGPSSDVTVLEQIVGVTGGKVYQAIDPLTIGAVIQDAIGLRAG
ncbi:MAG: substrate-binding domain-containing protein [Dermatophilaceae bacterium]